MIILDYNKKRHKEIIHASVEALKQGKIVAYPTDTSYGLAADSGNIKAVNKLYAVKEREGKKPVHVVVPSLSYAKKIVVWNKLATKLASKFLPGPLTLVLKLKVKCKGLKKLSADTGFLGIRYPKNQISLDLARVLKRPVTSASANPPAGQGWDDSYSCDDIIRQFKEKKCKPDIIINAGKLPKRKPSTLIKINQDQTIQILRTGPISEQSIKKFIIHNS